MTAWGGGGGLVTACGCRGEREALAAPGRVAAPIALPSIITLPLFEQFAPLIKIHTEKQRGKEP